MCFLFNMFLAFPRPECLDIIALCTIQCDLVISIKHLPAMVDCLYFQLYGSCGRVSCIMHCIMYSLLIPLSSVSVCSVISLIYCVVPPGTGAVLDFMGCAFFCKSFQGNEILSSHLCARMRILQESSIKDVEPCQLKST